MHKLWVLPKEPFLTWGMTPDSNTEEFFEHDFKFTLSSYTQNILLFSFSVGRNWKQGLLEIEIRIFFFFFYTSHTVFLVVPCILILAGVELIFLIAAGMVLYFGMKIVLITCLCSRCYRALTSQLLVLPRHPGWGTASTVDCEEYPITYKIMLSNKSWGKEKRCGVDMIEVDDFFP